MADHANNFDAGTFSPVRVIEHWIGGEARRGVSDRTGPVWNPAAGQQQAEVCLASAQDVDVAIRAAQDAFEEWSQASLSRRAKVLFAFCELLNASAAELAEMITDEHGKRSEERRVGKECRSR